MSAKSRLVFAGTPEFAVPCLRDLVAGGHEVAAVYTQPDRAAGRGRRMTMSPVKELALQHDIAVMQPENFRDPASIASLQKLAPTLMVVAAYGLILPSAVLNVPARGCVNVHASLLPRWRGAAPIARSIEAGDSRSGISLMQMETGLDTGPVFARAAIDILEDDTTATLQERLAELGAKLLIRYMPALLAGTLAAEPQNNEEACYAKKLTRDEARIDWTHSAVSVANKIRALNPWPVAESELRDHCLRIWHAVADTVPQPAAPGTVVAVGKDGVTVACGIAAVRLTRLQRLGGKVLAPVDFLNGFPIKLGDQFV